MADHKIKLNTVIADKLTADGVQPVTLGGVIGVAIRDQLRGLLKSMDPEGYAEYRKLKDSGDAGVVAMRFLFDRTRDLLSPLYISAATKTP